MMLKLGMSFIVASSLFFSGCRTTNDSHSETKGFGTENMSIDGKAIDKYVWAIPRVSNAGVKFICFYYADNTSDFSQAKQFSQYAVKQDDFLKQLRSSAQSISQRTLNGNGGDVEFVTEAIAGQGSIRFTMDPHEVPANYGMMTEQFLNDLRNEGRIDRIAKVTYKPFGMSWYLLGRIEKADMFDKGLQCASAKNAAQRAESIISSFGEQQEIMRSVHDALDSARHPTSKKSILQWKNVSPSWAYEGKSWGY